MRPPVTTALWLAAGFALAIAPGAIAELDTSTPDALSVLLDDQATRLSDHLEDLKRLRARFAQERSEEETAHEIATREIVALADEVRASAAGGPEADRLYDRIVEALQEIRPRLEDAIVENRTPLAIPGGDFEIDPAVRSTPAYEARKAELKKLEGDIATIASLIDREASETRWTAVELRAIRTDRLNALRIECLKKLSRAKRTAILSVVSREGIAQLRREVRQLALSARVYAATRRQGIDEAPQRMRDLFRVGTLTLVLAQLAGVVIAFVLVRRRLKPWLGTARRSLFPRVRGLRGKRRLEAALGAADALLPWTAFLVALAVARRVLGNWAETPELALTYRIALVYGLYRLGIDAAYAFMVRIAVRYKLALDDARRRKMFRSVRAVARLAAAIAVLLSLSALLLGKGYLYHLVVRVAWVFGLLIAVRLLGGWREEIVEAYLKASPGGRLAEVVRRTRTRWYGLFVAAASFVWLAGRGLAVLAKDFALEFDQTRKALAFLFRRRIEKQAESRGYAETAPEDLPAALAKAFSEDPVGEGPLAIDHFPGIAVLDKAIADWTLGRGGGAFLVTGEPGIGKTSWLARARADDVPRTEVALRDRPRSAGDLAAALSSVLLGPEGRAHRVEPLATALNAGPPRIVTVDLGQNLFLTRVGGYEPFAAFVDLVEATTDKVFWVCSFNAFAWVHLSAVRPDLSVFRHRQSLPSWSEDQIRRLIRRRLEASELSATYEDLVVDRMEGVSAQATMLETEEGYTRLLWDYADGNPRVALHFWLRSVVPETPRRVRVRLFRAPDPDRLERGGETALFILAAVVNHENLTLAETAEVTSFTPSLCRIHLDRFHEIGAMSLEGGRYRIAPHWQRAAIRLLRRRNLMAD